MSDYRRNVVPRGQTLPIDTTYRFSFGKSAADADDLPDGWVMRWIEADDPAVAEAGFKAAAVYIVDDGAHGYGTFDPESGGDVVSYLYLFDPDGNMVATWDEGRWWTPDESSAFIMMISVPDTYLVAEGIRQSSWNREMRRRRRRS